MPLDPAEDARDGRACAVHAQCCSHSVESIDSGSIISSLSQSKYGLMNGPVSLCEKSVWSLQASHVVIHFSSPPDFLMQVLLVPWSGA